MCKHSTCEEVRRGARGVGGWGEGRGCLPPRSVEQNQVCLSIHKYLKVYKLAVRPFDFVLTLCWRSFFV